MSSEAGGALAVCAGVVACAPIAVGAVAAVGAAVAIGAPAYAAYRLGSAYVGLCQEILEGERAKSAADRRIAAERLCQAQKQEQMLLNNQTALIAAVEKAKKEHQIPAEIYRYLMHQLDRAKDTLFDANHLELLNLATTAKQECVKAELQAWEIRHKDAAAMKEAKQALLRFEHGDFKPLVFQEEHNNCALDKARKALDASYRSLLLELPRKMQLTEQMESVRTRILRYQGYSFLKAAQEYLDHCEVQFQIQGRLGQLKAAYIGVCEFLEIEPMDVSALSEAQLRKLVEALDTAADEKAKHVARYQELCKKYGKEQGGYRYALEAFHAEMTARGYHVAAVDENSRTYRAGNAEIRETANGKAITLSTVQNKTPASDSQRTAMIRLQEKRCGDFQNIQAALREKWGVSWSPVEYETAEHLHFAENKTPHTPLHLKDNGKQRKAEPQYLEAGE